MWAGLSRSAGFLCWSIIRWNCIFTDFFFKLFFNRGQICLRLILTGQEMRPKTAPQWQLVRPQLHYQFNFRDRSTACQQLLEQCLYTSSKQNKNSPDLIIMNKQIRALTSFGCCILHTLLTPRDFKACKPNTISYFISPKTAANQEACKVVFSIN